MLVPSAIPRIFPSQGLPSLATCRLPSHTLHTRHTPLALRFRLSVGDDAGYLIPEHTVGILTQQTKSSSLG